MVGPTPQHRSARGHRHRRPIQGIRPGRTQDRPPPRRHPRHGPWRAGTASGDRPRHRHQVGRGERFGSVRPVASASTDANPPEDQRSQLWFEVFRPLLSNVPDRAAVQLAAFVSYADHRRSWRCIARTLPSIPPISARDRRLDLLAAPACADVRRHRHRSHGLIVTVINAFLSTWSHTRRTFGDGTPVSGAHYDNSGDLHQLEASLESAVPGSQWSGSAATNYDAANTEHRRLIGQLAGLDQRLASEVDRSAQLVEPAVAISTTCGSGLSTPPPACPRARQVNECG